MFRSVCSLPSALITAAFLGIALCFLERSHLPAMMVFSPTCFAIAGMLIYFRRQDAAVRRMQKSPVTMDKHGRLVVYQTVVTKH